MHLSQFLGAGRRTPQGHARGRGLGRSGLAAVAAAALMAPCVAEAGPLDAYLPKSGKIVGHIMALGVAPEDQSIDRRFRLAVQKNMDWFKKYVQGQKAGEALAWDQRMGISKVEYDQLQHMHADFRPGDAIEIQVGKSADGKVTFSSSNEKAKSLAELSFPADEKEAVTPFGALDIFNEIHQSDSRAPIGVWNGAEWARVEPRGGDKPSAKIAFGKRDPSGEGVMYYQIAGYKDHDEQSLVVFYKLD